MAAKKLIQPIKNDFLDKNWCSFVHPHLRVIKIQLCTFYLVIWFSFGFQRATNYFYFSWEKLMYLWILSQCTCNSSVDGGKHVYLCLSFCSTVCLPRQMTFALHQVNSLSSDMHHQLFIPYTMCLYVRGGILLIILDFYWYF